MSADQRISYGEICRKAAGDDDNCANQYYMQGDDQSADRCRRRAAGLRELACLIEEAEELVRFVRESGDPDASLTAIELALAAGFHPTERDRGGN